MDGLDEGRPRLSIEERASRRDQIERVQGDRYAALLHALRAGKEIDPRRRRGGRIDWHPIAGTLLKVGILVLAVYLVVTAVVRYSREQAVETWTGPAGAATVTSGQQLAGCPQITGYDAVFPRWVRFEGKVFRATGFIRPIGIGENPDYPPAGYALGQIRLHRIMDTPEGRAGNTILLRLASVDVGELYQAVPECS